MQVNEGGSKVGSTWLHKAIMKLVMAWSNPILKPSWVHLGCILGASWAQAGSKMGSRWAQHGFKRPSGGLSWPDRTPKMGSRWAQDGLKMGSRWMWMLMHFGNGFYC